MLKGHVFEYQQFQHQIFALFIHLFMNKSNGVAKSYKNAMNVTYSGHTVTIDKGACIVQGRPLEEDSSTTLDTGIETAFCKLVVEIDLDKVNTLTDFNQGAYRIVKGGAAYPNLIQEDTAGNNAGKYQYELARFKISNGVVTEFQDMRTYIEDQLQYGGLKSLETELNNVYETLNNLKAPKSHASQQGEYGLGNDSYYGHVKTVNNLDRSYLANGEALSAYQGYILKNMFNNYLPLNGGKINGTIYANEFNGGNFHGNACEFTGGGDIRGGLDLYNGLDLMSGHLNIYGQNGTGCIYLNNGAIQSTYTNNYETVTNTPNLYITSNGWIRRTTNTSSKRYKTDIEDVSEENLNPKRLYNLKVKQFKYKDEYQSNNKDPRHKKDLIGFIAEDVAEIYPIAADYETDENGNKVVENWNERYIIPAMLKLIQEQNERIKILEEKVGVANE